MNALDRWAACTPPRWLTITFLALLLATCARNAYAEPKDGSEARPTLIVLLPDGTVVPACGFNMQVLDRGPRSAVVVPCETLFTDGFEDYWLNVFRKIKRAIGG